jgi:hypothetical protein
LQDQAIVFRSTHPARTSEAEPSPMAPASAKNTGNRARELRGQRTAPAWVQFACRANLSEGLLLIFTPGNRRMRLAGMLTIRVLEGQKSENPPSRCPEALISARPVHPATPNQKAGRGMPLTSPGETKTQSKSSQMAPKRRGGAFTGWTTG